MKKYLSILLALALVLAEPDREPEVLMLEPEDTDWLLWLEEEAPEELWSLFWEPQPASRETDRAAARALPSRGFRMAGTPARMRLPVSGSILIWSTSGTCFTQTSILSILILSPNKKIAVVPRLTARMPGG